MENKEQLSRFKEKLLNVVGKYSDYRIYTNELYYIEERYDETLEIYHLDVWEGNSSGMIEEKAASLLRVTTTLFDDLISNAEKEVCHVLLEILEEPEEVQREILGFSNNVHLDHDMCLEIVAAWKEFEYAQTDALTSFLSYFQKSIKDIEEE